MPAAERSATGTRSRKASSVLSSSHTRGSTRRQDGTTALIASCSGRQSGSRSIDAPKSLVNLSPSTPVLPGQTVLATVRASSFSPVVDISVLVPGAAVGAAN